MQMPLADREHHLNIRADSAMILVRMEFSANHLFAPLRRQ
jgi:hypothetical protein